MLDQIKQFIDELPRSNQKICYAMGYDAAVNGADEKNCHFSLFSSKENTAAWEAGNRKGVADREAAQQSVQADEAICTAQYHIMLASKGDSFCGVCHIPLRR